MLQADGYAAMDSVSTAAAVYKLVRIKVGTGGNAKFYYGHLNAFKPSFGGVSFTLKYGRERDFNKE
jgi:hypothetical protein